MWKPEVAAIIAYVNLYSWSETELVWNCHESKQIS